MTPPSRSPGRYARKGTRLLSLRVLVGMITIVAVGVPLGMVAGFTSAMFAVAEIAAIGGTLVQDRLAMSVVARWAAVAGGEQHLDRLVD